MLPNFDELMPLKGWRDHAVRLVLAGPDLSPLALVVLAGLIAWSIFA